MVRSNPTMLFLCNAELIVVTLSCYMYAMLKSEPFLECLSLLLESVFMK